MAFVVRPARKAIRGNDYGAYHAAAQAVLEGADPYDAASPRGFTYLYPPTLAVLLVPLAPLPEAVAGCIWLLVKLLLLVWILRTVPRLLPDTGARSGWVPVVAGFAVVATLIDNELNNGQADLLVLGSIVLAWQAWSSGRRFTSGAAIAFGACLKVTPLLFVVFFVRRLSLRALAGVAGGIVALTLVLPALAMGPQDAWAANRRFAEMMVRPYVEGRRHAVEEESRPAQPEPGYSLRAGFSRWVPAAPAGGEGADRTGVDLAEWLYRGLAILLVMVAFLTAASPASGPGAPWETGRQFAFLAAVMVVVAPLSRAAHFVVLLPASLWLALRWWRCRDAGLGAVLLAAFLLIEVPFVFLPRAARNAITDGGSLLLGALVLLAALMARRQPGSCHGADAVEASDPD